MSTMINIQEISPEEYKKNSAEYKIRYSFYDTPFGRSIVGITDNAKALVHLGFVNKGDAEALERLQKEWPLSEIVEDTDSVIDEIMESIFPKDKNQQTEPVTVLLKGTDFQVEVWKALVSIPRGTTTTYDKVAEMIGKPKAAVAVGNALMKNQIAYVIPCHRVMGKTGSSKYSWGVEYKNRILAYEKET